MGVILKNNVTSTITTAISASDVGLAVATGTGSLFPTLGAGDYFYATLVSSGGTYEVVKVTARVGDTMTVARAQEGTTAQSFASGSRIELRVTAQSVIDAVGDAVDDAIDEASPITTVLDVAGLRAKTWPAGRPSIVSLVSLTALGDDGALFYWDNTSTATDDGISVIKETAVATGRWLRQYIGLFTTLRSAVRSEDYVYGSQTPTQQRVALQAAISEAISRGTWLQLQAGTIDVDTTSLTASAPIIIEGRSSKSVIRTTQDRGINPVILASGSGVRLRDIKIESTFSGSPTASSNNSAITFSGATDFEATGVLLAGKFYVGLTSQAGVGGIISECTVTVTENRGLYLYLANEDIIVSDNLIVGSGTLSYGVNINPGGVSTIKRISVDNNRIRGFAFHGVGVSESSQDVSVEGNHVETTAAGATCILIQRANTVYAGRVTVAANTTRGGNIGIYATEAIYGLSVTANIVEDQVGAQPVGIWMSDVYYASIGLNYVKGSMDHGIYVSGSGSNTCGRISIGDNRVLGPTNGIYIYGDVAGAVRHVTVNGNGAHGCPGNGLIANINTDRVIMTSNNTSGNGTNITNAGTNAVTDDNTTA